MGINKANYRSSQVKDFLSSIRNTELVFSVNNETKKQIGVFTDILIKKIRTKVSVFGLDDTALNTLEKVLKGKREWQGICFSFLEKLLLDVFVLAPDAPCLIRVDHRGEVTGDSCLHGVIAINVKQLVSELLVDLPLKDVFGVVEVSKREQQVLKLVRNNSFHTVSLYKKHGQLDFAESWQRLPKTQDLYGILKQERFQNIEIKMDFGKTERINRMVKTKFN